MGDFDLDKPLNPAAASHSGAPDLSHSDFPATDRTALRAQLANSTAEDIAISQARIVTFVRESGIITQSIRVNGRLDADGKNVVELAKQELGIPADMRTRGQITPELREKLAQFAPDQEKLAEYHARSQKPDQTERPSKRREPEQSQPVVQTKKQPIGTEKEPEREIVKDKLPQTAPEQKPVQASEPAPAQQPAPPLPSTAEPAAPVSEARPTPPLAEQQPAPSQVNPIAEQTAALEKSSEMKAIVQREAELQQTLTDLSQLKERAVDGIARTNADLQSTGLVDRVTGVTGGLNEVLRTQQNRLKEIEKTETEISGFLDKSKSMREEALALSRDGKFELAASGLKSWSETAKGYEPLTQLRERSAEEITRGLDASVQIKDAALREEQIHTAGKAIETGGQALVFGAGTALTVASAGAAAPVFASVASAAGLGTVGAATTAVIGGTAAGTVVGGTINAASAASTEGGQYLAGQKSYEEAVAATREQAIDGVKRAALTAGAASSGAAIVAGTAQVLGVGANVGGITGAAVRGAGGAITSAGTRAVELSQDGGDLSPREIAKDLAMTSAQGFAGGVIGARADISRAAATTGLKQGAISIAEGAASVGIGTAGAAAEGDLSFGRIATLTQQEVIGQIGGRATGELASALPQRPTNVRVPAADADVRAVADTVPNPDLKPEVAPIPAPIRADEPEIRWDRTVIAEKRLQRMAGDRYTPPTEDAPHGRLDGLPVLGRDMDGVIGGVYPGSGPREAIVVKPGPVLDADYAALRETLSSHGTDAESHALKEVFDVVRSRMKPDEKATADFAAGHVREAGADAPVELNAFAEAGVGVCRHHALYAGYLMQRLREDGVVSGNISIDRNAVEGRGAHAWLRYTDSNGEAFIVDPAQNYIGRASDHRPEQAWDYTRAA